MIKTDDYNLKNYGKHVGEHTQFVKSRWKIPFLGIKGFVYKKYFYTVLETSASETEVTKVKEYSSLYSSCNFSLLIVSFSSTRNC